MGVIRKHKEKPPKRKCNNQPHTDLVNIAEKWLYTKGCSFVLKEFVTIARETPDAIGFRDGTSILVECKTSRSDFKSDAKKFFRLYPESGMGGHRYYLCQENVIKVEDLPEGWGLLYVKNGKAKTIVGNKDNTLWYKDKFKANRQNEMTMLHSALRRVRQNGDLYKIFGGK